MKLTRLIAIGVIAGSLGIHAANAQSLANAGGPAEVPPASYKGKQYVDSRGCVYIRAGIDGRVSWVPRVSRDRKVICGFKPTLGAGSQVATAPAAQPAQQPVQITNPAPAAKPAPASVRVAKPAPKPAPVVRRVAAAPKPMPRPAPQPVVRVNRPAPVVSAAPRRVAAPAMRPVPAPAPQVQVAQNVYSCSNFSGVSAALMQHSDYPVRCGPQAENPTVYTGRYNTRLPAVRGPVLNADTMNLQGDGVRYGPQDVSPTQFQGRYNERLPATSGPLRYLDSMNRQAPAPVQRRPVATNYRPGYNPQQQQRPQVLIGSSEHVAQPVPPGYRSAWSDDRLNPNRPRNAHVAVQQPVVIQPRISTRSAPAQPTLKRDVIRASVQVGVYRDKASAQNIARRVQSMGLPVRIGILNRGNEQVRLVLAGPFGSESSLKAALGKVQRAGYGGAVIRR